MMKTHIHTNSKRSLIKVLILPAAMVLIGALSAGVLSQAKAQASIGNSTYIQAQSFDTCFQPSAAGLEDWWSGTPWYAYGFYLGGAGGSYVGCVNPGIGTIDDAVNDGFGLMPVWYGYEMPTSCGQVYFPDQISLNTSTAYNQGVAQANSASAQAQSDGFAVYDIIYSDLESGWDTGSSSCVAAAQSFVNGWDYQTAINTPYAPGLYGSTCGSDLDAYATLSNVPVAVWGADQNDNPETTNLECLSNGYWIYNQRIHQFAEENLTYNGYNFTVDENCVDALVDTNWPDSSLTGDNCQFIS
jgi:hypothetical protein